MDMNKQLKTTPVETKKRITPNEWLKNATKSLGYLSTDMVESMTPATIEFASSNVETAMDLVRSIRSNRTENGRIGNSIKNNAIYKLGADGLKNALEDIKSGKIYNKDRENQVASQDDDFGDFDFEEFDMSDVDDNDNFSIDIDDNNTSSTGSVEPADVFVAQQASNNTDRMIHAIDKQTEVSIKNTIASNDMNVAIASNELKHSQELGGSMLMGMKSINENLSSIVNFQSDNMSKYIAASVKYYEDSLNIASKHLEIVEKSQTDTREVKKEHEEPDLFYGYGGLNFKNYFDMVKGKNLQNAVSNNMILSPLASMLENTDALSMLTASPLKFLGQNILNKFISSNLKNAAESFDSTLANFFPFMLGRIRTIGENSTNPMMNFLGDLFGYKPKTKYDVDISNYNKGAMSFNGLTQKAITDVIPTYLRKILSAITNKEERIFNYEKGTFETYNEVVNRKTTAETNMYNGSFDFYNDMKSSLNAFNILNADESKKLNKSLDTLVKRIVKQGLGMNPFEYITKDGTKVDELDSIMEDFSSQERDLFKGLIRSMDKSDIMKMFGTDIVYGRNRIRDIMTKKEENMLLDSGLSVEAWGSDKDTYKNNKKTEKYEMKDSPFMAKDKFGSTTNTYLRDILYVLREGLITYPVLTGGYDINSTNGEISKPDYSNLLSLINENDENRTNKILSKMNLSDKMVGRVKDLGKMDDKKASIKIKESNRTRLKRISEENKTKLLNKGIHTVEDLSDISNLDASQLQDIFSNRRQILKDEDDKPKEATFVDKMFSKVHGAESIRGKAKAMLELPSNFIAEGLRNFDKMLFNVAFKNGDGSNKLDNAQSFFGKVLHDFSDNFSKFADWTKEKFFIPMHDALLGERGLFTRLIRKADSEQFKTMRDKISNKMFGDKNDEGIRQGGLLTGIYNEVADMKDSAVHELTGRAYLRRSDMTHIDEKETSSSNLLKSYMRGFGGIMKEHIFGSSNGDVTKEMNNINKGYRDIDHDPLFEMYKNVANRMGGDFNEEVGAKILRSYLSKDKTLEDKMVDISDTVQSSMPVIANTVNIEDVFKDSAISTGNKLEEYLKRPINRFNAVTGINDFDSEFRIDGEGYREGPGFIMPENIITKQMESLYANPIPTHQRGVHNVDLYPHDYSKETIIGETEAVEPVQDNRTRKSSFPLNLQFFASTKANVANQIDEAYDEYNNEDNIIDLDIAKKSGFFNRESKSKSSKDKGKKAKKSSDPEPPQSQIETLVSKDYRTSILKQLGLYKEPTVETDITSLYAASRNMLYDGYGETKSLLAEMGIGMHESLTDLKEGLFGKDGFVTPEEQNELISKMNKTMKDKAPKGIANSIVGAGLGAIVGASNAGFLGSLFLPGGPIAGAILGAGMGILTQSDKMMDWVFGKQDKETNERMGGFITKRTQDFFKSNKVPIIGGAVLGGLKSMFGLGFIPSFVAGGPLGGAIMGAAVSTLTKSERMNKLLFGELDEKTNKKAGGIFSKGYNFLTTAKRSLGKGLLGGAIGAGAALMGNQFGTLGAMLFPSPMVGALVGSIASIAMASDKFKNILFGEVDDYDNKRRGGLLPKAFDWVATHTLEPVQYAVMDMTSYASKWFIKTIGNRIDNLVEPVKQEFAYIGDRMVEIVRDGWTSTTGIFGKGLSWLLKTIGKGTKKLYEGTFSKLLGAGTFLGKRGLDLAGIPINLAGAVSEGLLGHISRKQGVRQYRKDVRQYISDNKENMSFGERASLSLNSKFNFFNRRKHGKIYGQPYLEEERERRAERNASQKELFAEKKQELKDKKAHMKDNRLFKKNFGYGTEYFEGLNDLYNEKKRSGPFSKKYNAELSKSLYDDAVQKKRDSDQATIAKQGIEGTETLREISKSGLGTESNTAAIREAIIKIERALLTGAMPVDELDRRLRGEEVSVTSTLDGPSILTDGMSDATKEVLVDIADRNPDSLDRIINKNDDIKVNNKSVEPAISEEDSPKEKPQYKNKKEREEDNRQFKFIDNKLSKKEDKILRRDKAKEKQDKVAVETAEDFEVSKQELQEKQSEITERGTYATQMAEQKKQNFVQSTLANEDAQTALLGDIASTMQGHSTTWGQMFGKKGKLTLAFMGAALLIPKIMDMIENFKLNLKITWPWDDKDDDNSDTTNNPVEFVDEAINSSMENSEVRYDEDGEFVKNEYGREAKSQGYAKVGLRGLGKFASSMAFDDDTGKFLLGKSIKNFGSTMVKDTVKGASNFVSKVTPKWVKKVASKIPGVNKIPKIVNLVDEAIVGGKTLAPLVGNVAKKGASILGTGAENVLNSKTLAHLTSGKSLSIIPKIKNIEIPKIDTKVVSELGDTLAKESKEILAKALNVFTDTVQGFMNNKTLIHITKGKSLAVLPKLSEITTKLLSKSKSLMGDGVAKLTKAFAKDGAKVLSAGTIAAAFAIYDVISGMTDSETANILKINKQDVTLMMKVSGGVTKALFGLSAVVDILVEVIEEWLGIDFKQWFASFLYSIFVNEKNETKLKSYQNNFKEELDEYNKTNKTNLTLSSYADMTNKSWMSSTWDKTKDVFGGVWDKTKDVLGIESKDKPNDKRNAEPLLFTPIVNPTEGMTNLRNKNGLINPEDDIFAIHNKTMASSIGLYNEDGKLYNSIEEGLADLDKFASKTKDQLGLLGLMSNSDTWWTDISKQMEDEQKAAAKGLTSGYEGIDLLLGQMLGVTDKSGRSVTLSKGIQSGWHKDPANGKWKSITDSFIDIMQISLEDMQNTVYNPGRIMTNTPIYTPTVTPTKTTSNTTSILGRRNIFGRGDEVYGAGESPNELNGFTYYSQNDPMYSNQEYALSGNQSTESSTSMSYRGCGPTAMAMVASELTGKALDPMSMSALATQGNYSTAQGTSGRYFDEVGTSLGLNVKTHEASKNNIQSSLMQNKPVILQGNKLSDDYSSPFTKQGHYVVAVKGQGDSVMINDPRGPEYSKEYNMDLVTQEANRAWTFDKSSPITGLGGRTYGELIVDYATKVVGSPYVLGAEGYTDWDNDGDPLNQYGAKTDKGYDCSGLVAYALNKSGITKYGRPTADGFFKKATKIGKKDLKIGDLGFVKSGSKKATHVGIYAGNGEWVEAMSGSPTKVVRVPEARSSKWTHYGRLPEMANDSGKDFDTSTSANVISSIDGVSPQMNQSPLGQAFGYLSHLGSAMKNSLFGGDSTMLSYDDYISGLNVPAMDGDMANAEPGVFDPSVTGTATWTKGGTVTAPMINKHLKGVLVNRGAEIITTGNKNKVDPALATSIMLHESDHGKSNAIVNYNNPAGIMDWNNNWKTLKKFSSLSAGITYSIENLKRRINEGNDTFAKLGAKYAPIGASNDPRGLNKHWVPTVTKLYNNITDTSGMGGSESLMDSAPKVSRSNSKPKLPEATFTKKSLDNNDKVELPSINKLEKSFEKEVKGLGETLPTMKYNKDIIPSNTPTYLASPEVRSMRENITIENNSTPDEKSHSLMEKMINVLETIADNGSKTNTSIRDAIKQNFSSVTQVSNTNNHASFSKPVQNTGIDKKRMTNRDIAERIALGSL